MGWSYSDSHLEIYKSIIEHNSDGIFVLAIDGTIMEVNQTAIYLFGYSQEEFQGRSFLQMAFHKTTERVEEYFRKALQGVPSEFQTDTLHKNGGILHLQVKLVPLYVREKVVGVFCVTKDITEQKQLEKSLRESEERYRKLSELSPRGIVVHRDGVILYVNPATVKMLKEDHLIGKDIFSYVHPDSLQIAKQRIAEMVKDKNPSFVEMKLQLSDGELLYVDMGSTAIHIDGSPAILMVFTDDTEKKMIEQALMQSEKRYRRLVENSPEPIVIYQNESIQYANPACVELFGESSLEGLVGKSIFDYFHPDSVHLIENRIHEVEQIGTKLDTVEEKLVRRDGTVIDVDVTGITIRHEGKLAFLMMYHDISRRKRAEQALRESEQKYRLIAENMHDLICLIDWDGRFIYASPSHTTLLGFPTKAYEGNFARDWMHKEDHPKIRSQLENAVRTQEPCMFEFRFRDIKDNWIWLEGKATPVFDHEGNFKHFLVVSRDITERKAYEEKLAHLAFHDALTGLPNRRLFRDRFKQAIKEAERYGRKMAVMYMDMDRFKSINDTLGHDVGDKLLKKFAQRVKDCLRNSDILARLGGDEFTVLLPEIEQEDDVVRVAQRILASIQQPWEIGEHVFETSSSIGIAFYPMDGTTRQELLRHADEALYSAKESGRNTVKTYSLSIGKTHDEV
ncbi:hypothetical protein N007_14965 [Alicyclobacillus acidoterrestris ATCC 49025]|nr:hypothetical protein N007_14965 [Alicyclobacillus acidoterrestris ATCC 49025]